MNVLEVINVTREVTWLPWAVQYFFLIGISVACLLMSLPGALTAHNLPGRFTFLAVIGALTCGIVAPVALLADLHQPGRFWRFYTSPNLRSWMAWGAFFIPVYLGFLMLFAWGILSPLLARSAAPQGSWLARTHHILALRDDRAHWLVVAGGAGAALFGLLVFLYTGMELMVVRARPLWATPYLPLQLASTSFIGAAGLVIVLNRLIGDYEQSADAAARGWLVASVLATMTLGMAWFLIGLLGLDAAHAKALRTVAQFRSWQLTAAWAAAATVILLALVVTRPARLTWLAGLVALHAAWMFRWTVFIGGQTVPKTGAGLYAYNLPLGHEGLLGIAGTFGLWLALLIVITSFLPQPTAEPDTSLVPAE